MTKSKKIKIKIGKYLKIIYNGSKYKQNKKMKMVKMFLIFLMVCAAGLLTGFIWAEKNNGSDLATSIVIDNSHDLEKEKVKHSAIKKVEIADAIDETIEILSAAEERKKEELEKSKNRETEEITRPFSFVAIADSENFKKESGYNNVLEGIIASAKSHNPDFAIFTGDILNMTSDHVGKQNIKTIKKIIEKYFSKYYITFGKHDVECGKPCIKLWQEVFWSETIDKNEEFRLYHSFEYQNTHFAILSTDYPLKHSIDNEQLDWLEKDLSETKKPHKIVIAHIPPVNFFWKSAKECHDMSCNPDQRDKLNSILKKNKVDLVISGHEHTFDHKIVDGIDYILAGNSGNSRRYKNTAKGDIYTVVSVTKTGISLKGIRTDGKLIRKIKIK